MQSSTRSLSIPIKLLSGLESGRLRMHPGDYRNIAGRVRSRLDRLGTWELIEVASTTAGLLGEMAEAVVFDRTCGLVHGRRDDLLETERVFEALLNRLLASRPPGGG